MLEWNSFHFQKIEEETTLFKSYAQENDNQHELKLTIVVLIPSET